MYKSGRSRMFTFCLFGAKLFFCFFLKQLLSCPRVQKNLEKKTFGTKNDNKGKKKKGIENYNLHNIVKL